MADHGKITRKVVGKEAVQLTAVMLGVPVADILNCTTINFYEDGFIEFRGRDAKKGNVYELSVGKWKKDE